MSDKFKQPSKQGKQLNLRTDVPSKKPTSNIQTLMKKHAQLEFVQELAETGRANWKKAPKELKNRYYGIYMVMFSIPLIAISSWEMYRRLEGKSTKKVQEGEMLDGQLVRKYDEVEKWSTEKNSLMYRIFGRDFFLDGFTSKTMGGGENGISGAEGKGSSR